MKEKTNRELKIIAVTALKAEYGFAPKQSEVILREAHGDGTYIEFRIADNVYSFSSYKMYDGSVWCGKGTITKMGVRESEYAYGERY